MKKFLAILFILPVLALGFEAFTPVTQQAEAARFGGGRSFGSRPSYNRSAPAQQRNIQQGQQQNAVGAPMAARAGMGGFLGPLLAGSLLGALFFGGAFSGLGFADILVVGIIIYMLTRLLRRRHAAAPAGASGQGAPRQGMPGRGASGEDAWRAMRSAPSTSGVSAAAPGVPLPADFDLEKFMHGAKLMYARMQEAWDKRDLDDIAQFTTPGMYNMVKEQALEDPEPGNTEVLTLNAVIYGFEREGAEESVAVFFDGLVREYADQGAHNAREVWHFIRSGSGNWKLDGIQQVEG